MPTFFINGRRHDAPYSVADLLAAIDAEIEQIARVQLSPVPGMTENIVSIWKWNAPQGRWAFYSPQLTEAVNTAYATAHNYDPLLLIYPGEGYWVAAINPLTLPAQTHLWLMLFIALPMMWNSGELTCRAGAKSSPATFMDNR